MLPIHFAWNSVSLCAAHPSCIGVHVIERCSSILHEVLYHYTLRFPLAWSSVSLCAANPSCMEFCVIERCSSILRGVLCYWALLFHLAWSSVLLSAALPSYVEFCIIERCSSILRGVLYYSNFVSLCATHPSCVEFYVMDSMLPVCRRFGQSLVLREAWRCIGDLAEVLQMHRLLSRSFIQRSMKICR